MPNFVVTDLGPLSHNGVVSYDGDQVTLDEEVATPLLEIGVIAPAMARQKPGHKEKDVD